MLRSDHKRPGVRPEQSPSHKRSKRNPNSHRDMMSSNLSQSMFGFSDFGPSFTSFSSLSSGSTSSSKSHGIVKSTTKSTKMINGKKFVTIK